MIYRNFLTPLIPIQINKFANAIPVELRVEKISVNETTETMEETASVTGNILNRKSVLQRNFRQQSAGVTDQRAHIYFVFFH